MLFTTTTLTGLLGLVATAWTSPVTDPTTHKLEARQAPGSFMVVRGIPAGQNPPPRLELRQLQANADAWNIFLLGMQRFMSRDQNDPRSYYQIAGIHGRPFGTYNGIGAGSGLQNNGYCTHSSILFVPWHRPYLALFEQTLYGHMFDVVNTFTSGTDRTRYANAARNVRLPYLDWAAGPSGNPNVLPDSVLSPTVSVRTPAGTQTIANPLYSYRFHPIDNRMGGLPWSQRPQTLRYPTSNEVNAQSQMNLINPQLARSHPNLKDRLYRLFSLYDRFDLFSNDARDGTTPGTSASIEDVHNSCHGLLGNGGHMSYVQLAAHDPLFWFHHAMVDRAAVMWQAIYPNSYVGTGRATGNTYTIRSGDALSGNSALTPFTSDVNGGLWTPDRVRDHRIFGYSYLAVPLGATPDSVRNSVNRLYGPGSRDLVKRDESSADVSKNGTCLEGGDKKNDNAAAVVSDVTNPAPGGITREYIVDVKAQRFGLGTSYTVYIFLGKYCSDPNDFSIDKNLVGSQFFFAQTGGPDDSHAHTHSGLTTAGSIPLTRTLKEWVDAGRLASLEEKDVLPLLKEELHWEVTLADDTRIPVESVPGLKVSVAGCDIRVPSNDYELPSVESDFTKYVEVTVDKPAGAQNVTDAYASGVASSGIVHPTPAPAALENANPNAAFFQGSV